MTLTKFWEPQCPTLNRRRTLRSWAVFWREEVSFLRVHLGPHPSTPSLPRSSTWSGRHPQTAPLDPSAGPPLGAASQSLQTGGPVPGRPGVGVGPGRGREGREGQRGQQSWGEAEECTAKSKARDPRPGPQMIPREEIQLESEQKGRQRAGRGAGPGEGLSRSGFYRTRPAEPSPPWQWRLGSRGAWGTRPDLTDMAEPGPVTSSRNHRTPASPALRPHQIFPWALPLLPALRPMLMASVSSLLWVVTHPP